MPARKDCREQLFDHIVLADDNLLQFLLHDLPMLGKFLQHVTKAFRLLRHSSNQS
jgi:hypothetical protein